MAYLTVQYSLNWSSLDRNVLITLKKVLFGRMRMFSVAEFRMPYCKQANFPVQNGKH